MRGGKEPRGSQLFKLISYSPVFFNIADQLAQQKGDAIQIEPWLYTLRVLVYRAMLAVTMCTVPFIEVRNHVSKAQNGTYYSDCKDMTVLQLPRK